ncbi:unnamed protein product [Clonostachys solani]|uniref:Uncharacterized protein n=1 Tax=Clonostachys solani TaxID=160281 RepID=A0A9N9Z9N3_9HYPO|nr:unnamed protein product [Clonostachys solani]
MDVTRALSLSITSPCRRVERPAWLLDQGASVNTPIPGSKITALILAVLGNRVPTALLLLANHADPDLREHNAQDLPTVLHLVCTLGLAELADRLLTGRYSAWELLALPMFSDHLTVEGASRMLWAVLSLRGRELAEHVETAVQMLRHLLGRGANSDLGRFLWRQPGGVSYPVLLKLLPPLLEAGMNIKPAPSTRRRARRQPLAKYGVNDLLGQTSPYDESQDDEGAAAQLGIIHLLLQHGAPSAEPRVETLWTRIPLHLTNNFTDELVGRTSYVRFFWIIATTRQRTNGERTSMPF